MKYPISVVVALLSASSVNAFTAPRSYSARPVTSLDVTTLDQWQLLDNGSLVGSVKGHPTLTDGDVITTSPLSRPDTARSSSMVSTLTGSQYQLGLPMQLGGSSMAPAANEPGFGRSTFVKVAGTASLFAGGLALGVGVEGIVGEKPVSIAEVRTLDTYCLVYRVITDNTFLSRRWKARQRT